MSNSHPASSSRESVINLYGRHTPSVCRLLSAALLILFWANSGFAIPFSDYRDHVSRAINSLDLLSQPQDGQTEARRTELMAVNIRSVQEALPRTQTVEWQGTSFTADNSWLDDDLKKFAGMPVSDANRAPLLAGIHERLQALQERLEETDKAAGTEGLGKDEMQGRLAAILQRSEYGREVQQRSALDRLLRWLVEFISKLMPRGVQLGPGGARILSVVARVVVIALALALILYCIRLVVPRFLGKGRPKKKTRAEARVVLGERLEPDQSGADLLAEAEALARAGELRAAIRKGYIALLVELGDRKVISLAQHKTNRDYLRSVREIENLHGNLVKLTSSFELHWYGLAQASESDWTAFRAFYREALRGVA